MTPEHEREQDQCAQHLEWASEQVRTWPVWKQTILGGKANTRTREDGTMNNTELQRQRKLFREWATVEWAESVLDEWESNPAEKPRVERWWQVWLGCCHTNGIGLDSKSENEQ